MRDLGNVLWFLFGGLLFGLLWVIAGVACCITLIMIPVGLQCFKLASMTFFPFGKEIRYEGGAGSCIVNVLWVVLFGWELALTHAICGLIFFVTIIGIPFGIQHFKIARLALVPFGAVVVQSYDNMYKS